MGRQGADINAKNNDGWTPLIISARYGQPALAEILITQGAHINAKTKFGYTALMISVEYGQPELAKVLIEKNAALTAQSTFNDFSFGYTVLDLAKKFQPQLVPLLKAHGAKSGLNN